MEQTEADQIPAHNSRSRNPVVAALLSLVIPGMGHVYNGQIKKGLTYFCLLLVILIIAGATQVCTFFYGLLFVFLIEVIIRIYVVIETAVNASRLTDFTPRKYNTWYYHLLISSALLVILIAFDVSYVLGVKTFIIPTSSNSPTLQVGDWMVADFRAYTHAKPAYGDLVIFTRKDGDYYNSRVVGLPNDTIEVVDDILRVNGKLCKSKFIREEVSDEPVLEWEEVLPNGHNHLLYKYKNGVPRTMANTGAVVVPPDSYFLMSDNRDNAFDSRYEGAVAAIRIKGRLVYSYWGQSSGRINIDFRDK